jgi:hypothetical protein
MSLSCAVFDLLSFVLCFTNGSSMLGVVILNVVMLSVVAPNKRDRCQYLWLILKGDFMELIKAN